MPKYREPTAAVTDPALTDILSFTRDPAGTPTSESLTLQQMKNTLQDNVVHTDVDSEISTVPEKISPVAADLILIEDSEDSNEKKSVQAGNIVGALPPALHAPTHESGGTDPVNHDNLTGFVSNEHIDHSVVTITGTKSVTGGGDITASRTIELVNDDAAPGNEKYYGTNAAGVKGYFDVNSSFPRHQTYLWTINGNVVVGATQDGGRAIPRDMTITNILIFRGEGGNAGDLIVDINSSASGVAPVTLYTTQANRPTVNFSESDWFVDVATLPDIVTLNGGDYLTVDVDSVETGGGGTKNVTVLVEAQVF